MGIGVVVGSVGRGDPVSSAVGVGVVVGGSRIFSVLVGLGDDAAVAVTIGSGTGVAVGGHLPIK